MSEQDGTQVSTKPRRSGQVSTQKITLQRPANDDKEAWKAYWKAQGQSWRTEPEIDVEQQKYLAERRSIEPDIEQGIYPFKDIKLSRADVEWLLATHENGRGPVDWNDKSQRERKGLDIRGADLSHIGLDKLPLANIQGGLSQSVWQNATLGQREIAGANLKQAFLAKAHLEGAELNGAHLDGVNLGKAYLKHAQLEGANLEKAALFDTHFERAWLTEANLKGVYAFKAHFEEAILIGAHFEEATLFSTHFEKSMPVGAHFEKAELGGVCLKGAFLSEAHFEEAELNTGHFEGAFFCRAHLEGANIRGAFFDVTTNIESIILSNDKLGSVSLADARWGEINLAVVDWTQVPRLGDEQKARFWKKDYDKFVATATQLDAYHTAVRANRQLAVVLRSQGLNEEADHFAYRAQLLQRVVWRRQRRILKYILS